MTLSKVKYTDRFISQLIIHKYYLALPMHRLDAIKKSLGYHYLILLNGDFSIHRIINYAPAFTELERRAATQASFIMMIHVRVFYLSSRIIN